jgi:hypothetical protein
MRPPLRWGSEHSREAWLLSGKRGAVAHKSACTCLACFVCSPLSPACAGCCPDWHVQTAVSPAVVGVAAHMAGACRRARGAGGWGLGLAHAVVAGLSGKALPTDNIAAAAIVLDGDIGKATWKFNQEKQTDKGRRQAVAAACLQQARGVDSAEALTAFVPARRSAGHLCMSWQERRRAAGARTWCHH